MRPSLLVSLLWTSLFAAALLVKAPPAAAETRDEPLDQEETILRILELRDEIEELLESLPPEIRSEVERRWRDRQRQPAEPPLPTTPEPTTGEVPNPASAPTPETVPRTQVEAPAEPIAEPTVAPAAEPLCGGFPILDTDHNGVISAGDRQWRFLRLWFDNGDNHPDDDEIESLYSLGVDTIDIGLRFYTNSSGDSEDIDIDQYIRLRNVGKRGQKRRIGTLVVDSDRLSRDGVLTLTDLLGQPLTGVQPLGGDSGLALDDGRPTPLLCPEDD